MPLQLLISDLDGTIVETEDYHRRAYNLLFKELGLEVTWTKRDYVDRLKVMGGGKLKEVFSWLRRPASEFAEFKRATYEKKTQLYLELITKDLRSGELKARPGVKALFKEAEEANLSLAVGTACEKKAAFSVLHEVFGAKFSNNLLALCGGDDTPFKKPDPSIYLLVAQRCGVKPENCLVLEDTRHGMQAALAAGMKCVVAPSEYAMDHDSRKRPSE